jgi:hypothetical protein
VEGLCQATESYRKTVLISPEMALGGLSLACGSVDNKKCDHLKI